MNRPRNAKASWAEIAHHTISFEQISVERRGERKEKKKIPTNSHEAHSRNSQDTHAKLSKNIRKNRIIRLNRLFDDVKMGL
jgi:hypothetical protein